MLVSIISSQALVYRYYCRIVDPPFGSNEYIAAVLAAFEILPQCTVSDFSPPKGAARTVTTFESLYCLSSLCRDHTPSPELCPKVGDGLHAAF